MAPELYPDFQVILVPGLHDSGPGRWQSRWQRRHPEIEAKFGVADSLPSQPLDCPTLLISSVNDPWMRAEHASLWARRWGSELVAAGALGHINAASGLGDWPLGWEKLHLLYERAHNDHPAMPA